MKVARCFEVEFPTRGATERGDEMQFDATANLEDVVDDPDKLNQLIDQAADVQERRLWDDAEWTTPRFTILKDVVKAFAVGVIQADAWFVGYSLPPNFEVVCNSLCGAVETKFSKEDGKEISLLDIQAFYREFIDATPPCREWNDFPGESFVSRYSSMPTERTFIDLDALVQNACNCIRNDRREFDRFDAEFEAKYASTRPAE